MLDPLLLAGGTEEVVDTVQDSAKYFTLEYLAGWPLHVLLIIVIAVVLNFVLRRLIRRFAQGLAAGTASMPGRRNAARRLGVVETEEARDLDPIVLERRRQRTHTVASMLSSITTIIIAGVAGMMTLQELGFNLAPILASAGIAGLAIGFGAQELVKDYLSGFFIVVEDQYGIGDTVDVGDAVGTVESVEMRVTKIRDIDGTLWHVRNAQILRVGNFSQGWARAVLDLAVPYGMAQSEINAVIEESIERTMKDPEAGPKILERPEILGIQALTGESQTIRVSMKTRPNEQWTVARIFRSIFKGVMDERGLRIPLAQQTVIRTSTGPLPVIDPNTAKPVRPRSPGRADDDADSTEPETD